LSVYDSCLNFDLTELVTVDNEASVLESLVSVFLIVLELVVFLVDESVELELDEQAVPTMARISSRGISNIDFFIFINFLPLTISHTVVYLS